jgi:hypothetical protein
MVLTVSFVLSPVIGLFRHRHLARLLARLDAGVEASGPHDFAVRVSTVRQWCHPRPPHPARVDDVGQRPSVGQDTRLVELICPTGKAEYFSQRGWTAHRTDNRSDLPVGQIRLNRFTRRRFDSIIGISGILVRPVKLLRRKGSSQ